MNNNTKMDKYTKYHALRSNKWDVFLTNICFIWTCCINDGVLDGKYLLKYGEERVINELFVCMMQNSDMYSKFNFYITEQYTEGLPAKDANKLYDHLLLSKCNAIKHLAQKDLIIIKNEELI